MHKMAKQFITAKNINKADYQEGIQKQHSSIRCVWQYRPTIQTVLLQNLQKHKYPSNVVWYATHHKVGASIISQSISYSTLHR